MFSSQVRQDMKVIVTEKPVKRLLFWTPRIMCILFGVFGAVVVPAPNVPFAFGRPPAFRQ